MKYATEAERLEAKRASLRKWQENNRETTRKYAREHLQKKRADPDWVAREKERQQKRLNDPRYRAYRRNYHIKRNYGLSPEQFFVLERNQKGLCAICKSKPKKLCIDHDHITGKVRGLLCNPCNQGLGHLRDNITNLISAINYLKGYES
jgi:hypothetical protein